MFETLDQSVGLPGEREAVLALLAGALEAETERQKEEWRPKPKRRPWWKLFQRFF